MIEWIPRPNLKSEALSEREVPLFVSELLSSRGISTSEQMEKFLYPKLSELRDPYLIDGMEKAVEKLSEIYQNQEAICIYADFDLDGTSGLALFKDGLEKLGFKKVLGYQPKRLSQGYGIHKEAIDEISEQGIKNILTIDVGITANEAIQYAVDKGLFVILTDHHLPSQTLPPAQILVNPNIKTEHPLSHLSGAGVAFYLLWALSRHFKAQKWVERFDLKSFLDCFVIGTLTDMVPLVDENRVLVKHGMLQLAQTQRPGLRVLLSELGLWNKKLSSEDIAISFAPKLNALSRMEMGLKPIDVFLVPDEVQAQALVKDIFKNNSTRIDLQKQAEKEAHELLTNWAYENFVFVVSAHFHKGVIGLIATKLTQFYNKPAFVGCLNEEGRVVVSSRRPDDDEVNLVEVLTHVGEHLVRFGGHAQAAGFEFEHDQLEVLLPKIEEYYALVKKEGELSRKILFDKEFELQDFDAQFMNWYEFLGPFGEKFERPLFLVKNVLIQKLRELKGGHLKYSLRQNHTVMEALIFSPLARQKMGENLRVDILARPQWNYFAGRNTLQLLVEDIRPSSEL